MEDVNWLRMDLLLRLCDKVNEMHSNSIKVGGFLDKQFLKKKKKTLLHLLIITYFESFAS